MDGTIRRNNGWIHRNSRLPRVEDGGEHGQVLVWHAFQDAVLARWDQFTANRFHVYWMPLSDLDDMSWINAMEIPPREEDADKLNCVMALDAQGHISVTGYHQFRWNKTLLYWRKLPGPPSDAKRLREMN